MADGVEEALADEPELLGGDGSPIELVVFETALDDVENLLFDDFLLVALEGLVKHSLDFARQGTAFLRPGREGVHQFDRLLRKLSCLRALA